jgi:branched-chain amino acid transport system substrate-binding protein
MTHRFFLRLALAAFLALVGGMPAPAAQISDGVVKIGLLVDLHGPYAELTGKGSIAAAQIAVEEFGGTVLGAPIEVVSADHGDNSDRAAVIARDWFEHQKVDAVLDVAGSSEALRVQAIGHTRNKIVSISAAAAVRLTNEGCTSTSIHYTTDTYASAHVLVPGVVKAGGNTWFFITVDYSFGYDLEGDAAAVVTAEGGQVLGRARHPLNTPDFRSYLAQAQLSHAKVIALANGGSDMRNAIAQAALQRIVPGNQTLAALSLRLNGVDELGLDATQGMMLATPFYWDMNDATREWSKRFHARVGKMPNALQAGLYSSVRHYLKAVEKAGTDATEPVMQAMRDTPVDDMFAHGGHIRADGLMVHDMYLYTVKSPNESHYPWDYLKLVATIPGDKAFQPLGESKCPLVRG